jgi:hypothetical protein
VSIEVYLGILNGIADRILCLSPGVFDLALRLLNHAFNLELGIAGQLARRALGASNRFVDCALGSILVHELPSQSLGPLSTFPNLIESSGSKCSYLSY